MAVRSQSELEALLEEQRQRIIRQREQIERFDERLPELQARLLAHQARLAKAPGSSEKNVEQADQGD